MLCHIIILIIIFRRTFTVTYYNGKPVDALYYNESIFCYNTLHIPTFA